MAVIETWYNQDLQNPVKVHYLNGNLFSHNGNGNRIGVHVFDNGEPVTLAGTVSGYVVTSDGSTVPCTGSRSGNNASILVPPAAYQPGAVFITVFLTDGNTVTTLASVSTSVLVARTENQVSPGSVVTDWTQTINAAMQDVETAAENLGKIVATPYPQLTFPVPLGKYTYYNNNLYRCISPIASSESFTPAHWSSALNLGDEVSSLKSALNYIVYGVDDQFSVEANKNNRFKVLIIYGEKYTVTNNTGVSISVDLYSNGTKTKTVSSNLANGKSSVFVADRYDYNEIVCWVNSGATGTIDFQCDFSLMPHINLVKGINNDKEINQRFYNPINYNLESGVWVESNSARSILIPVEDLSFAIKLVSETYKLSYAFLKNNTVTTGQAPNLCDDCAINLINAGNEYTDIVPEDCKYLYVYISNGTYFGQNHIINVAFRKSAYKTKDTYDIINNATDKEVNLTRYSPVNYNLESGSWTASNYYKSVLIPIEDLCFSIKFISTTYKCSYAFLKSNEIQTGNSPDLCVGTNITNLNAGKEKIEYVPKDCKFLYVYISDGTYFGQFHVINKAYRNDITNIREIINNDNEINISSYTPLNYNLESGIWASSESYRCVLIPLQDLSIGIKFVADTYKCSFAFLKNNSIAVGLEPNLCDNSYLMTIPVGNELSIKIPSDCQYLYVYISDGQRFNQFHAINLSLRNIANIEENRNTVAYIADVDQILRTIKHRYDGIKIPFTGTNVSDSLLVLAHISDVHSDPNSYGRFINLLNDNVDTINAGIVSGDLVDNGSDTEFARMISCEGSLSSNAKLIKVIGNHERQSSKTQAEVYEAYNLDTNTGKSYYYVDFAEQKIRIICLDQYDVSSITVEVAQATAHYSQTQIDWLISTLKSAKSNNYAVIVVLHSMNEVGFPMINENGFCQNISFKMPQSTTSGTIISDIINAFKKGLSISGTYSASDTQETITVSDTFTGNGDFIGFICGHEHVDFIGYSTKYPDQLISIVQGGVVESEARSEAVAHWQSMYDTPRVANTSTADSINVYGIDTDARLFKVVKIGSTLTDKFVPRSFAKFKY